MFKFIDATTIQSAPNVLIIGGSIIGNPTEAHLRQAGYKDVVVEAEPAYDAETQMLVPSYTDGAVITQSWTVVAKPPVPVTPPSLEERVDACEYMLIDMLNFM